MKKHTTAHLLHYSPCLLCPVDWRHSWGLRMETLLTARPAFLLDDVMCVSQRRRSLMRAVTLSGSRPALMKSSMHPVWDTYFSLRYRLAPQVVQHPVSELEPPRPPAHSHQHTHTHQTHTYSPVKQQHNTGSYLGFVCNLFGRFVRQAQWY